MEKWQIYAEEARTQIRFAKRSYSEFERCRDASDCEGVFYHLHHFIAHVAAIDGDTLRFLGEEYNLPELHAGILQIDQHLASLEKQ
jgi:hypothetical protein